LVVSLRSGKARLRRRSAVVQGCEREVNLVRARQARDMTDEELANALADRRQELFNLRFQSATGALENPARLKLAKREIARILTVLNERETAS
jgi:large subunit ribosomal protein L29